MVEPLTSLAANSSTNFTHLIINYQTNGTLAYQSFRQLTDIQIITSVCNDWSLQLIWISGILALAAIIRFSLRIYIKHKRKNQEEIKEEIIMIYEKTESFVDNGILLICFITFFILLLHHYGV
jgi:hypothetical protein